MKVQNKPLHTPTEVPQPLIKHIQMLGHWRKFRWAYLLNQMSNWNSVKWLGFLIQNSIDKDWNINKIPSKIKRKS
jgi:hypothetical protein